MSATQVKFLSLPYMSWTSSKCFKFINVMNLKSYLSKCTMVS